MRRLNLILGGLALVAVIAACSPASGAPASSGPADPNSPTVVAKNIAFDKADIAVPAGKAFQLVLDNQEGAPHNVAIYTDESAKQSVFVGEIFSSARKTYDVPAMDAGSYFFRCDVHPDMKGTVTAR
jgi:plastocyanin